MRFRDYIKEEYLGIFKSQYMLGPASIFKNPLRSELNSLRTNTIRFTADTKTKTIYVWDADKALHAEVFDWLVEKGEPLDDFRNFLRFFHAVAEKIGGKWICTDSDEFGMDITDAPKRAKIENKLNWVKTIDVKFFFDKFEKE